jgi:hypothetical protein
MIMASLKIDAGLCHSVGDHNKTGLHWGAKGDHVEVAAALIETELMLKHAHPGARLHQIGRRRWEAPAWLTCSSVGVRRASP